MDYPLSPQWLQGFSSLFFEWGGMYQEGVLDDLSEKIITLD
ncbi:hypothetical protein VCRA2119O147_760022 [Vibrio crassostreae]|uniref:Uncharacterized protein n=2 Tax=Vibrio TaxID=662 RepID=A0A822N7P9_9VIBR|nr:MULTISPECIES: hypothetical protein [Vibrio]CAH7161147.1 conserved hypothetical protein [Vibrio chagasii]CAH7189513.1 conserved hypothetical protein [Vibrio chagasii]CAH7225772.1 conserved hypothetical protein [Vibrio chagasii]CAK1898873.1 hypothetical protein VCRA2112O187_210028 [Vibrio crassostreae]CAK1929842.1 hypothetical protein VCRA2119O47_240033 [Vibrio crassostreae]